MGTYRSRYGPAGGQPPHGQPPPADSPPPPRTRPRRRYGLVTVLACAIVLVLALAAVAVIRPGPVDRWLGGGDNAQPTPAVENTALPPPVLAGAGSDAPAPTAAGIKGALDPLVADPKLGGRVFVSVVDPVTGDHLYERSPATPAVPASTTKLVTGLTVLAARGPSYRLATRAVAGTRPGEVVLIGGGDATLATGPTGTYPGAARLDELAAAVKQALGATPPTKVIVDTSLFTGPAYGPGWDSDASTGGYGTATTALMTDAGRVNPRQVKVPVQRHEKPDVAAGQAFAKAFGLPASAVTAGKAPAALNGPAGASPPAASGTAVAPGTELGRIESPPMARLVEMMLSESDNVIAECLARQVALAKNLAASYAGAAEAMKAVLADLGLPAAEDGLVDGSGLSRNDRLTPSLLTGLLAFAARADRPDLHGLFSGLPVAGYSGTLRDRFRSAGPTRPGAGLVRAKTGTLSGVNAIAGIVVTQDGRLLTFAVLADRVTGGQFPAQDALDKIATALATCGCR